MVPGDVPGSMLPNWTLGKDDISSEQIPSNEIPPGNTIVCTNPWNPLEPACTILFQAENLGGFQHAWGSLALPNRMWPMGMWSDSFGPMKVV